MTRSRPDAYVMAVLAILAPLAVLALVGVMVFIPIPDGPAVRLLDAALGSMTTIMIMVYGFFFGTSLGSREKDRVIYDRKANQKETA